MPELLTPILMFENFKQKLKKFNQKNLILLLKEKKKKQEKQIMGPR